MTYSILVTNEVQENIDEALDILKAKIGIDVHKKDLIPLLFRNPSAVAQIVIENIKATA